MNVLQKTRLIRAKPISVLPHNKYPWVLDHQCLRNKITKLTFPSEDSDAFFRDSWNYYASDGKTRLRNIRKGIWQNIDYVIPFHDKKASLTFHQGPRLKTVLYHAPENTLNVDRVYREFLKCFRTDQRFDKNPLNEDRVYKEFLNCFRPLAKARNRRGKPKPKPKIKPIQHKPKPPSSQASELHVRFSPFHHRPRYASSHIFKYVTDKQLREWEKEAEETKEVINQTKDPYVMRELTKRLNRLNRLKELRDLNTPHMERIPESKPIRKKGKKPTKEKKRISAEPPNLPGYDALKRFQMEHPSLDSLVPAEEIDKDSGSVGDLSADTSAKSSTYLDPTPKVTILDKPVKVREENTSSQKDNIRKGKYALQILEELPKPPSVDTKEIAHVQISKSRIASTTSEPHLLEVAATSDSEISESLIETIRSDPIEKEDEAMLLKEKQKSYIKKNKSRKLSQSYKVILDKEKQESNVDISIFEKLKRAKERSLEKTVPESYAKATAITKLENITTDDFMKASKEGTTNLKEIRESDEATPDRESQEKWLKEWQEGREKEARERQEKKREKRQVERQKKRLEERQQEPQGEKREKRQNERQKKRHKERQQEAQGERQEVVGINMASFKNSVEVPLEKTSQESNTKTPKLKKLKQPEKVVFERNKQKSKNNTLNLRSLKKPVKASPGKGRVVELKINMPKLESVMKSDSSSFPSLESISETPKMDLDQQISEIDLEQKIQEFLKRSSTNLDTNDQNMDNGNSKDNTEVEKGIEDLKPAMLELIKRALKIPTDNETEDNEVEFQARDLTRFRISSRFRNDLSSFLRPRQQQQKKEETENKSEEPRKMSHESYRISDLKIITPFTAKHKENRKKVILPEPKRLRVLIRSFNRKIVYKNPYGKGRKLTPEQLRRAKLSKPSKIGLHSSSVDTRRYEDMYRDDESLYSMRSARTDRYTPPRPIYTNKSHHPHLSVVKTNSDEAQFGTLPEGKPLVISELVAEFMRTRKLEDYFNKLYPGLVKPLLEDEETHRESDAGLLKPLPFDDPTTSHFHMDADNLPLPKPERRPSPPIVLKKHKKKRVHFAEKPKSVKFLEKEEEKTCCLCKLIYGSSQETLIPCPRYIKNMQRRVEKLQLRNYFVQKMLKEAQRHQKEPQAAVARQVLSNCDTALKLCQSIVD